MYRELTEKTVHTDLTHAFRPGQPHFPGFGDERRETPFDLGHGDGFTVHRYTLVGQWGTHVDPPGPRSVRPGLIGWAGGGRVAQRFQQSAQGGLFEGGLPYGRRDHPGRLRG